MHRTATPPSKAPIVGRLTGQTEMTTIANQTDLQPISEDELRQALEDLIRETIEANGGK
jgi:hypothetical protein